MTSPTPDEEDVKRIILEALQKAGVEFTEFSAVSFKKSGAGFSVPPHTLKPLTHDQLYDVVKLLTSVGINEKSGLLMIPKESVATITTALLDTNKRMRLSPAKAFVMSALSFVTIGYLMGWLAATGQLATVMEKPKDEDEN